MIGVSGRCEFDCTGFSVAVVSIVQVLRLQYVR